jgi:hypothetical protein
MCTHRVQTGLNVINIGDTLTSGSLTSNAGQCLGLGDDDLEEEDQIVSFVAPDATLLYELHILDRRTVHLGLPTAY